MPRALARELLAEGGALAQPSECRMTQEKRLKDAKAAAKASDIRVLQTHHVGVSCFRGFRFAAPPATSHSLRSGIRPFRSCSGVYSLPGVYFLAFETEDVGCVVGEVCFDDDFC